MRESPRRTPWPVALSAFALVLVAAASEFEAGLERLRTMPAEGRARLQQKLRDFDGLAPEQQAAARELDRRLAALPPAQRDQYLDVLRRYHAWLNSLPEQRQDELSARPPGERMAKVRALIRDRPVPAGETPSLLRVSEPGEYNPFEVASAYRIWRSLDDSQRKDVEGKSPERARRQSLIALGARRKDPIPRETTPPDFDEEKGIDELKSHWRDRLALMTLDAPPKGKADEAVKKRLDASRPAILHRQAINLYVSRAKVRPVEPGRLARFLDGLPPWIPPTFDSLSPDEARRRMTLAYRLVFPEPEEIGVARKPAAPASKGRAKAATGAAPPAKAPGRSAPTGKSASPF